MAKLAVVAIIYGSLLLFIHAYKYIENTYGSRFSVIQGVSMSIIGEKRLGKPPLPSGGLTIQPPYSTPMGPWGGWGGGRVHQRGGADVHQPLPSLFRRFYGTY